MLTIDLFEKWSNKYKKSINCANPKGFSQKAHCAGRKKHNESVDNTEPEFIQALRDFLPIAIKHLKLKSLPKIHLQKQVNTVHVASFGGYDDNKQAVTLVINNRQPADILRTLAHELVHWGQGQDDKIDDGSWHDGSELENEANAVAGVIMRDFARQHPKYLELTPIVLESIEGSEEEEHEESDPTKPIPFPKGTTLVNVSDVYDWYKLGMAVPALDKADPRTFNKGVPHTVFAFGSEEEEHRMAPLLKRLGFTLHDIDSQDDYQKAIRASDVVEHLEQYVAENLSEAEEGEHCNVKNAVPELKAALTKRKTELKNADAKTAYDKIDKIMTRIAQTYNISGQELHDLWTERYGEIPDTWVLGERKETKLVTIHTNPNYRGATIAAGVKEQLPITKMPIEELQMWESDKTLRTKKVREWVKNTLIPKLKDKGRLMPLIVWNHKGKHFVIDGNHRFLAYRAVGFKGDVPVRVVPQEMIAINNKVLEPIEENFSDSKIKESKETRQALSDQHFEFPQQGQYGYRQGYKGSGVLELADGRTGKIINLGEFGTFNDEYKPNQKWLRIVFTNPNMDDTAWDELEDMLWSDDQVAENFADGKKPGRKGLAKRSGVNCKQSVTKLRSIAKNSSGERQRMAHWCANMKSGKK